MFATSVKQAGRVDAAKSDGKKAEQKKFSTSAPLWTGLEDDFVDFGDCKIPKRLATAFAARGIEKPRDSNRSDAETH